MSNLLQILSSKCLSVPELEELYAVYGQESWFIGETVRALRVLDPERAPGAVWLLAQAAKENRLEAPVLKKLVELSAELTHWTSRLVLCQLFARARCPEDSSDELFAFLEECFQDRRVIVRAWAVSAMMPLSSDPRFKRQIAAHLRNAKADPAKSMRARMRHLQAR